MQLFWKNSTYKYIRFKILKKNRFCVLKFSQHIVFLNLPEVAVRLKHWTRCLLWGMSHVRIRKASENLKKKMCTTESNTRIREIWLLKGHNFSLIIKSFVQQLIVLGCLWHICLQKHQSNPYKKTSLVTIYSIFLNCRVSQKTWEMLKLQKPLKFLLILKVWITRRKKEEQKQREKILQKNYWLFIGQLLIWQIFMI